MPARSRLPTTVWMLGLVSLFMDLSSEMIYGLLPVFLTTVVGASALAVGLIEGVAEATASFMKLVSGAWSDRMGKRKPLAVLGYGLAALSKPFFPLADTAAMVLGARIVDRVGKGIRGAPRDALIADVTQSGTRGAAFGLRQSLDTVGAFSGPLLAVALMAVFSGDMRAVFAVAIVPALISVAILVLGVKEPPRAAPVRGAGPRFDRTLLTRLPRAFWLLLLVTAPFMLARFSEAFLLLRAQSLGLALALIPLTLVVMNVVYAASAYPAGRLSDRWPQARLLLLGCIVLLAANLCLALGDSLAWAAAGTVLWGLHMGLTEGLIAALVADRAPVTLRGTAFGVMHFSRGVLLLAASALAGWLWDASGPQATFLAGAGFAVLTLLMLPLLPRAMR
ncbi:MAG TPA: MFS transporter [Verrucomicrobiae bacterium]|nr:MFS transporter [Verrucomicrobiae bacterium]